MKRSKERILTTHAGSLVRPPEIIDVMRAIQNNQPYDEQAFASNLRAAVFDVVRKQAEIGIDVPSDGEFGKRGWIQYVSERLAGLEYQPLPEGRAPAASSVIYTDRERFAGFYSVYTTFEQTLWMPRTESTPAEAPAGRPSTWVCTGPISYKGQAAIQRDIENFKAALADAQHAGLQVTGSMGEPQINAFMPMVAPCSVEVFRLSEYYPTEEAYLYAIAGAMKEEYNIPGTFRSRISSTCSST